MSSPTALPAAAITQLGWVSTAPTSRSWTPALSRAALLAAAAAAAITAAEPLTQLPWPIPVTAAALGWAAVSGLTPPGRAVAASAGAAAATRLILATTLLLFAGWAGSVALAPGVSAADRPLGWLVGAAIFGYVAVLTTGAATGAELTLLRWSSPLLLLTTGALAGPAVVALLTPPATLTLPDPPTSVAALLLVTLALPLARTAGIACWGLAGPRRGLPLLPTLAGGRRDLRRLGLPTLRRAAAGAALGLGQAAAVVLLWRTGSPGNGGLPPSLLPLLIALPAGQVWLGWHLRRPTWRSLLGLLIPLLAAAGFASLAHQLPHPLAAHPDPPVVLLSIAGGLLLAGVVVLGWLLAERGYPGSAAAVTAAPVLAAAVLTGASPPLTTGSPLTNGWLSTVEPPLATTLLALGTAYAGGLALAARTLRPGRRRR
ncbi:hypothetical protein JQS43_18460 [Natronosporangium hydrolyticum]|uniref:Uncharacterized protein n=1 Tax=Natronosporangium hydrolyticum TaxID=2811111 RepID=A0A895YG88_9ACTN|nr:hypothetical protein [Natronosporangium hydrolyticum]QSB13556.1 hypothetical protein JQS43_18460 [Natronosporangium hydrolyticum]